MRERPTEDTTDSGGHSSSPGFCACECIRQSTKWTIEIPKIDPPVCNNLLGKLVYISEHFSLE